MLKNYRKSEFSNDILSSPEVKKLLENKDEKVLAVLGHRFLKKYLKSSKPSKSFVILTDSYIYLYKVRYIQYQERARKEIFLYKYKIEKVKSAEIEKPSIYGTIQSIIYFCIFSLYISFILLAELVPVTELAKIIGYTFMSFPFIWIAGLLIIIRTNTNLCIDVGQRVEGFNTCSYTEQEVDFFKEQLKTVIVDDAISIKP